MRFIYNTKDALSILVLSSSQAELHKCLEEKSEIVNKIIKEQEGDGWEVHCIETSTDICDRYNTALVIHTLITFIKEEE